MQELINRQMRQNSVCDQFGGQRDAGKPQECLGECEGKPSQQAGQRPPTNGDHAPRSTEIALQVYDSAHRVSDGEAEPETGDARAGFGAHLATKGLHELLHDGKPYPGASSLMISRFLYAVEAFEDMGQVV